MTDPTFNNNILKFSSLKVTYYFRMMILIIVKLLLNLTRSIRSKLEKIKMNLTKSNVSELNFHALTPEVIENNETIEFYINSLQWAIQKDDCYNIALMGIYGSGKSTIIQSFFGKHSYYTKVLVSLANFENDSSDIGGIEKSIIQQIFYTVKESSLPNSGLKRIKNHRTWSLLVSYFVLCSTTFLATVLIYPEILIFINLAKLHDGYLNQIKLTASGFLLILSFFFFKKYQYFIQQLSVKLNLQNAEISLPSSNFKSIINEYLDELIYFFEVNHCDIVVFEDLDRYKDKGIFSKLRELNTLLNNHEAIKKKGKITFLYAVKDDIFGNNSRTTRTKFFDFILPVISVMNSSNSYAQIKKLLPEEQITKLTDEFLNGVSLYINDLRLLKNICNEFTVYKKLINDIPELEYSSDSLFAMVIYKNYHPSDFNDLLKDKGQLHRILSSEYRKKCADIYSSEIKQKISLIQKQLDSFTDNLEEGIKNKSSLSNEKIKLEKVNVYNMPLSELVTIKGILNFDQKDNQNPNDKIDFSVFESELIQFLIKNGYLDENYQLYISHYVDGGLTKNDISFVLYVNENRQTPLDYDLPLTFIPEIFTRLQPNKFSTIQILNFSLFDYLVEKADDKLKGEILGPITQLNRNQSEFIEKYFERGINLDKLLFELFKANVEFFDRLLDSSISSELKSITILDFLVNTQKENLISALMNNAKLADFISTSELLLDNEYIDDEKLVKFMSQINHIKLKVLKYSVHPDRLQLIEKKELFDVNLNNITVLYNSLFNPISKESKTAISPILTKLFDDWNPDTIDYLLSSKNFVNAIYSGTEIIHNEKEEYLLSLIEVIVDHEEIKEDVALETIFEKTSTIITDIITISNLEIQKYLIRNNRLKLTWSNVISFQNNQYEEELQDAEIGDPLIQFIAKNTENECLDFSIEISQDLDIQAFLNFKLKILFDPRFDHITFRLMLKTIDEEFIDQIEILIQSNLVKLTKEWVEHLKQEEWDTLVIDLYKSRISELLENYESFNISDKELCALLKSDLQIKSKINLFLKYNFTVHNGGNKISSEILFFANEYFHEIAFNLQQMLPLLKYTITKDQSISKSFAIKLIKQASSNNEIMEIVLALNLTEFNALWNYSSNMQDFYNTKENIEIFKLLGEKGLVGKVKPRKSDGKLQVYKKKKYNSQ